MLTVTFARLLVLRFFSGIFEEKGDCSQSNETLVCDRIQMNAVEQSFHVVPFIMLYKVILTLKSVDETLVCDHSIESY